MDTQAPSELNQFAQRLFTPLPARYDRLAEVLSMGQNGRWRRAMVDHIVPEQPGLVLDVACGPAGVSLQIADRTRADVVGVDLTLDMLRQGRRNVADRNLAGRVSLAAARGEQLPFADQTFDALTFTYLLRYVDDPQATLHELARVVRPGGVVANLEFLLPQSRFWRFWWWGYTRLTPAGGRLRDRGQGVVRGRPIPWAQHLRALSALSAELDGGGVAHGRTDRRRRAAHEPRGWPGDVGAPPRWMRQHGANRPPRSVRPSTPRARAASGTGGPCSTRPTPPGTWPTWS